MCSLVREEGLMEIPKDITWDVVCDHGCIVEDLEVDPVTFRVKESFSDHFIVFPFLFCLANCG